MRHIVRHKALQYGANEGEDQVRAVRVLNEACLAGIQGRGCRRTIPRGSRKVERVRGQRAVGGAIELEEVDVIVTSAGVNLGVEQRRKVVVGGVQLVGDNRETRRAGHVDVTDRVEGVNLCH